MFRPPRHWARGSLGAPRLRLRKGDEAFLDKITGPGEDDREQVMHRIGQKIYFED
jgi:hypothetical protein